MLKYINLFPQLIPDVIFGRILEGTKFDFLFSSSLIGLTTLPIPTKYVVNIFM